MTTFSKKSTTESWKETVNNLRDEVAHLRAELWAHNDPQQARIRAFESWQDMVDKVEAQRDDSEGRKQFWVDRLNGIVPLFDQFDKANGERHRLNLALMQSREQVSKCLDRITQLEKENKNLIEIIMSSAD